MHAVQCTRQNSRAHWQNGRMAEGVLPDTIELAEPPAHQAKLVFRAVFHSLGQGTSSGVKKSQKNFSKVTKIKVGRILRSWDKLLQTLTLRRALAEHGRSRFCQEVGRRFWFCRVQFWAQGSFSVDAGHLPHPWCSAALPTVDWGHARMALRS